MSGPFTSVAILGCGLIGGSLALASRGLEGVQSVRVTDHDERVRAAARRELGACVVDTVEEAVAGAELVVVAVPVDSIAEVVAAAAVHVQRGAILTDVGSVKSDVVAEVEAFLAEAELPETQFLGGHPMAGSERRGFEEADPDLFRGATWLLTPTRTSAPEAFNAVAAHLRAVGAHVLAVDPATHDRIVAVTSHLPQVVASTLAAVAEEAAETSGEGVLSTAAGGFRDVTRVAGSDPDLWTAILAHNRRAVGEALAAFRSGLVAFEDAIERGDRREVHRRLQEGRAARQRLPVQRREDRLVDVVVPLPNRPGMLAEVTTTLGAAGINVEDLEMRHGTGATRGVLVVAVNGWDTARRARGLLSEQGFPGHLEAR